MPKMSVEEIKKRLGYLKQEERTITDTMGDKVLYSKELEGVQEEIRNLQLQIGRINAQELVL